MKIFKLISNYITRNKYLLSDKTRKVQRNRVNLHRWHPKDDTENLGDYLAVPIYDYITNLYNIDKNTTVSKTKHLYTVGSIIFMGLHDATIWGSGLLSDSHVSFFVKSLPRPLIKLDIRSLRGPETRRILMKYGYKCPEIYGDPAILMPLIYSNSLEKKYDYTLIHHMSSSASNEGANILTNDYKSFIDRIIQSKLIISGSLHGIILAEVYGVPAILLKDRHDLDLFKYNDYYYSTGRYNYPIATTVDEALSITPPAIPDFTKMQQDIINSFPKDLFN